MADKPKYYAQFDGDFINDKRYAIGDEVADTVDVGTLAYLITTGRVGESIPAAGTAIPIDGRKSLGQMNRDELIVTLARESVPAEVSDDDIRDRIESLREARSAPSEPEVDDTPPAPPESDAMLDDAKLSAILNGPVPDVEKRLADLSSRDDVQRVRALEVAGANRSTALAVIDARLKALDNAG